jgi:hypothetical protein
MHRKQVYRRKAKKQSREIDWKFEMFHAYKRNLEKKQYSNITEGRRMLIEAVTINDLPAHVSFCAHALENISHMLNYKNPTTTRKSTWKLFQPTRTKRYRNFYLERNGI